MFQKKPFFKKFNRPFIKPFVRQNKERVNEQIRVPEIRVIDETGANLGVLNTQTALQMAKEVRFGGGYGKCPATDMQNN